MDRKFEFGEIVKDVVTGATGAVMCFTDYHSGCTHIGIQPMVVDTAKGTIPEWIYLNDSSFVSTGKFVDIMRRRADDPVSGPQRSDPPQM